jgi:hypothetical protein
MAAIIQNQLNLFDIPEATPDNDEVLTAKANHLIEMLNEGLKKKEQYKTFAYTQVNDLIVLIVANKEKDFLGNVLDSEGNTPKGFSVCWRNLAIVKQDIQETLN